MNLKEKLIAHISKRKPDFIVGDEAAPYLQRWWIIPRNRIFNIYLHRFMRDDDDRALHDHPYSNMSIILRGEYLEHTIRAGGVNVKTLRKSGQFKLRMFGSLAHRIQLVSGECWTIFITGPRYREWGFHCPQRGWVHWQEFVSDANRGVTGKGCD